MTIVGLNQVTSSASEIVNSQNDVMGKNDFLQLLVVQLQEQDPLNPMDSTEFTAQLAQFSSLEQLQNVNTNLEAISTSQSVLTNSQAVGFIGNTVTAIGNSVSVEEGASTPLQIDLENDAAEVYITLSDQQGTFVRDLSIGGLSSGTNTVAWDGLDYQGVAVEDGVYTYSVSALDSSGKSISTTQYVSGIVTGVNFKDGTAYLQIGSQEIAMGNIVSVLSAEN